MTTVISNYTINIEQARSRCYLRALQEEIMAGSQADESSLKRIRINHPEILSYKARILGHRNSYKEFVDWTHFLVTDYGPCERCLSLGSGIGRVEKYLVTAGFTDKMETIELCADENEAIRLKDSKIATESGDLNFIDLEPNSYDFILCHGVLHHLINLEHVLYQINRGLKRDGLVLIYEYVGENRWQFNETRFSFLRKNFPSLSFRQRPVWKIDGFESVRSDELYGLIQKQFGNSCERAVSYGGVYFPFLILCTTPEADVHIGRVLELDEKVSNEGALAPCYHMGLYRKNDSFMIPAKRWSDDELESRLVARAYEISDYTCTKTFTPGTSSEAGKKDTELTSGRCSSTAQNIRIFNGNHPMEFKSMHGFFSILN